MRPLALLLALIALAVAGCGEDSKKDSTTGTESSAAAPAETETETTEEDTGGATTGAKPAVSTTTDLSKKPVIPKQSGDPPAELVSQDVVKGKGATAEAGDTVTVRYVGVRFRDGQQFDASWDRPDNKFEFPLGAGQVIQGWDKGVAGMKVGGRRQLTIPPDLAYGAQGAPPDIAPNETLIFVVDLKKVQKG